MDVIAGFWSVLPGPMRDPVLFAIPFFLLLLVLEWIAARKLEQLEGSAGPAAQRPPTGSYRTADAWASISMGLVSVATTAGWKFIALLGYTAIYAYLAPWQLAATHWYTWVIAILGVDLLYYTYHRIAHRVRLIWATHQAHHSSRYFNFATALRQKWNPWGELLFWTPLPLLGVPPWMIFFAFSLNLIFQFWVHTETIPKLWGPVEFILNTPSHHRVHHASQKQYLDRNYAGILIIWDRLFGTYAEEEAVPVYGLTVPVTTHNPFRLQYGEFVAAIRDVRGARTWRERAGYLFAPPGWKPADPVLPPESEVVTR